jgi:light-regulated signal transduction histidine kinase (bacteriophytochrome)
MADQSQLLQVVQNLLENALKFCKPGQTPKIHIGAEHRGNEWLFSVHDNGIGIDPKYHDKIFTIFQRLHSRQKYSGTGIGLAIVKRIIERHGGRVCVESKPDEGSTFYFTLPDK